MGLGVALYNLLPLGRKDVVDNLESDAGDLPGSAANDKRLNEKIGQLSNPNLLDNGNLAHPINQRGYASHTITSNLPSPMPFIVDRWIVTITSCGTCTVSVTDKGIKGTMAADSEGSIGIRQFFDENLIKSLEGKTITMTIKVSEYQNHGTGSKLLLFGKLNGVDTNFGYVGITGPGVFSKTIVLPSSGIEKLWAHIYFADARNGSVDGDGTTVEWVKMEIGDLSTPFVPPDPATEWMKCQRYYKEIGCQMAPIGYTANELFFKYSYQSMRIPPTPKFKNNQFNVFNGVRIGNEGKRSTMST